MAYALPGQPDLGRPGTQTLHLSNLAPACLWALETTETGPPSMAHVASKYPFHGCHVGGGFATRHDGCSLLLCHPSLPSQWRACADAPFGDSATTHPNLSGFRLSHLCTPTTQTPTCVLQRRSRRVASSPTWSGSMVGAPIFVQVRRPPLDSIGLLYWQSSQAWLTCSSARAPMHFNSSTTCLLWVTCEHREGGWEQPL